MIIKKILPQGFCYGVYNAYEKTKEIIRNNPNKKIYMLGWLVHNEKIINEFINMGLIVLNDKTKSRLELIKEFNTNVKNSILILSAHGTEKSVIELAKNKGFEVYDLTCQYVYKTHLIIKQKIEEGNNIIFIGKKNHPETNAILKINENNIILIENIDDIKHKIDSNKKYFCTNQTTISQYQFNDLINEMKKKNNNIEFVNDICDATKIRQDAVINMDNDFDLCLVIGDNKSSNTHELYEIARKKVESHKINDINDINLIWFKNKNKCAITAGASTPRFLIDQIIDFIERKINESN